MLEANEAFARMHGYAKDELKDLHMRDLVTGPGRALLPARLGRLLGGETLTFEVEHCHRDGHIIPFDVSASLVSMGGLGATRAGGLPGRDSRRRLIAPASGPGWPSPRTAGHCQGFSARYGY